MNIVGSVALVTGANRGLGKACARELVSRVRPRFTRPRVIPPPSPNPT